MSAAAAPLVRVGFIGPLSGPPKAKGLGGRNAAMLAVERYNGRPDRPWTYELIVRDDACDPAVGRGVAEALASDSSITAGVTHYCSQVALECVHVYHRHGFPVIVWGAHHPGVTDANDYPQIHRVSGVFANEDEAAADFMIARGFRRWIILHDQTHYGEGHAVGFATAVTRRGGTVAASRHIAIDQQDFSTEIPIMAAAGADVVLVVTAPDDWWKTHASSTALRRPPVDRRGWMHAPARLARSIAEAGMAIQIQGPAGFLRDLKMVGDAGPAGEGMLAFEEGAPLDRLPGGAAFARDYAARGFADPPEGFGPFAYAATTRLMDAIDEVGPDRGEVCAALGRTRNHPSLIGPITFNAKGQNVAVPISVYRAEGGTWRRLGAAGGGNAERTDAPVFSMGDPTQ